MVIKRSLVVVEKNEAMEFENEAMDLKMRRWRVIRGSFNIIIFITFIN